MTKQRRPGTPGTAAARAQRLKRRGITDAPTNGTAPDAALHTGTSPTKVDMQNKIIWRDTTKQQQQQQQQQ